MATTPNTVVFKTNQSKIFSALQSVSGIVERRSTMPILANVMLKSVDGKTELTTSDLEIQIKTKVDLGGTDLDFATTVGARKLLDILRTLPSDQIVSLEADKNDKNNTGKLILKGGKSRFVLQTLPAQDFPVWQESQPLGDAFSISQKVLKTLLGQIAFSMAVNDIRYYLNGMLFVADGKTLSIVATDGHRLAFASTELEVEVPVRQEVILPRKTVVELQRLLSNDNENVTFQFAANQAKLSFSGMDFVTKLVDGRFPDYKRVIPKSTAHHVEINRIALLAALQRTNILTSDKFKGVRLTLDNNTLKVTCNNSDQEEALDEIEIEYSDKELEINFNITYLLDALGTMDSDVLVLNLTDGNSSAMFTLPNSPEFKYVVMPMRV